MSLVPEPGPLRVLAVSSLVNTFGNGLMFTTSALYFTRIVGLSAAQVGVGLSVAGFVGLLSGMPLGHLADRLGPREMQMALVSVVAVLTLLYTRVQSFWQFVVVASAIVFFDGGTRAARGALIARAVPYDRRVYARAYLRSITNVGITLGAAVAGIALHLDTPAAGARSMVRAGWVLLVACAMFALAEGPGREAAIAILIAAAGIHVYGEILQSAGSFCLNVELAPEHAQGQYQGLAGTGMTLSFMLAPAVVAFLPLGLGRPGWLLLGGLFVTSGMALVPITAWAERTRGRYATLPPAADPAPSVPTSE
jgi:hypothetical protein